ncbi:MAG: glycogen/starch/alpha-glucan phosphorylase [Atopobiaceae bacterium]|jgi:starch phosphorylase|nr:glycogen/starch/alpha-glucan phosphorylase [Atopobiaceae bacterium]MCI2173853.1 glycogen/starch/alpha-glucan phosphorylase [Atopobiaceae bacterium]MCI2208057.1 glycogen/starch/alpha-glucan phosphorylase [Atopobiaceae bacterium]
MQRIFSDKEDFIRQYRAAFQSELGKDYEACDDQDRFTVLAKLVGKKAQTIAASNEVERARDGKKRVYYFSLEFLIGRLLDNYLLDFGVRDMVAEGLSDMGADLDVICSQEPDAGLGNGGLGRLAACFLDSMAHEGIAGYGNGMRYRYGLFRQAIKDGRQVEETDNWLVHGYPWEVRKPESAVIVRFGGEVVRHEKDGKFWFTWDNADEVLAVPYDVPVAGYGGETVNKLRIWSAEPVEENFDLDAFNRGEYAEASKSRADVEAISMILYPNDSGEHGRLLRLKQEYLFVAAGIASIIRTFHKEHGTDWTHFPDYVAIHTNDTHPAMCGAELMRILIDEEGLDWDTAWDIVTRTLSYTNHTVLPEALEKWPINTFRTLLPRVYMYIDEIDRRYRESFPHDEENWQELLKKTAILWDGEVRMANLSVICSHSVNGVSDLHTKILERDVLKEYYELTPEKFNNKTNGVSHRRFLAEANPSYARLITEKIGDHWLDDADDLKRLEAFEGDEGFLDAMAASKRENKVRLAKYVKQTSGVDLDCDSVFDVQVKRFHAYKRQLLNVFKVLDVYNRILSDSSYDPQPTSFIFSGKAAQSYDFAKEVIRLINSVADVVNNDPRANDKIRVAFIPNFAVSNAQLIYPAAEISEQISTAGKEASGTSNMKLMMNGAITLGTLDGANVEIAKLAGEDDIKIFGLKVDEVDALREGGRYFSWDVYNADRDRLGKVVDELVDGTLAGLSGDFESIHDTLMLHNDEDFVLADFRSYVDAWEELEAIYPDQHRWNRMALHNTANSGFFASDRTIREYASDIWHV